MAREPRSTPPMGIRRTPDSTRLFPWLLAAATVAGGAWGCRVERSLAVGDTIHAQGFAAPSSPSFHGPYLAEHGFPLADCRKCHGGDYEGGSSQSSCTKSGCHTKGVESCDTCHAAKPVTGAHGGHDLSCTECHPPHVDARGPDHPDGKVEVPFSTLAKTNGTMPSFDPQTMTCSDVYCHGGKPRVWEDQGKLGCDGCHDDPPSSHAQFATKASDCTQCHGSMATHIDGKLDVSPIGCDGCHGRGPDGAPPPGLGGATSSPAIGAHARHLDGTLPDRIGHVARCNTCHTVPKTVADPGHIDASAPADVKLRTDESYDAPQRTCVVGCHWNRDPGPRWDDASGSARACDSCHAFPPVKTRTGTTHPPAAPNLDVCVTCHQFDPSTHVDGKVDFAQ